MRIYTLIVVLFYTVNFFGQQKTIEINIPKKKILIGLSVNKEGDIYIKTGTQKIGGYFHKTALESYNKNLEKRFYTAIEGNETLMPPSFQSDFYTSSDHGAYFRNIDELIDDQGELTSYPKGSELLKQSNLNATFRIFSDIGYTLIGPEIGRKNVKKIYGDSDLKIWTRFHEDGSIYTGIMELPDFETNKEVVGWQMGQQVKNGFYLVAKDDINEAKNLDIYHLSLNNYQGNHLKYIKLEVKLEEDYFLLSKSGHGFKEDYPNYNGIPSYSGILPDAKNEHIYAYGYYTKSDKKQVRVAKIAGLYVQKFDLEGNLIWKKKYPFEEIASEYLLYRQVFMLEQSENLATINYSYGNDEAHFTTIDITTGNIKFEKRNYLDDFKVNNNNLYKREVGLFRAGWYDKKLKKRFFGKSLIKAFTTNPEIKEYVENLSSDNTLYFESYYLREEAGLILMEFNGKKRTLTLRKF